MKVLAINSSPSPESVSVSRLTMHALADGMEAAGARVRRVDLRKVDLRDCTGCYSCFFKTPGECILPDEMSKDLFQEFVTADTVILSSPLYFYHVNGAMKTFIDRTHPFLLNPLETDRFDYSKLDHRLLHTYRSQHPRMITMVGGQSYVSEVFEPVSAYFRYIYRDHLAGEFYRTESVLMGHHGNFQKKRERLLAILKEAGRRYVEEGDIPAELQEEYNKPFDSMEAALDSTRLVFDTCLSKKFSMSEFIQRNHKWLYPTDAEHFQKLMELNFNPAASSGIRMNVQFQFSDLPEDASTCYFRIDDGAIESGTGKMEQAGGVEVTTSLATWTDIMHGRSTMQQAVMKKEIQLSGDLLAMLRFPGLFAGRQYE